MKETMPKIVTKEMLIIVHDDLLRRGGKAEGILCQGTIDYVLDNIERADGVFAKAAWALYMSREHPFIDGNKRTSFILAETILRMNGFYLGRHDEDEIFRALHRIADATIECDVARIERWLRRRSKVWWRANQRTWSDYL